MHREDPYGLAAYGARLQGAKLHKKEKRLEVSLDLARPIDAREAEAIAASFCAAVPGCEVNLTAQLANGAPVAQHEAFFEMLEKSWMHIWPVMRVVLKNAAWEQKGGAVCVRVPEKLYPAAKNGEGTEKLVQFVSSVYGFSPDIRLIADATMEAPQAEARGEEEAPSFFAPPKPETRAKKAPAQEKNRFSKKDIIFGRPVSTKPAAMATVSEESGTVTVRGEIISIDARPRKNGGFILNFYITDKSNTLPVKAFLGAQEKRVIERLEEAASARDWVVVHGRYDRDQYANAYCVFADFICRTDAEHREDKAEKKRVELHLHTKMSAMDGFIEAEKAVEIAAHWGHRAIAITDHGVVQAFPAAVSAAKKLAGKGKQIKVLLGLEGYLLPDCTLIPMQGSFCAVEAVLTPGVRTDNIFALAAIKRDETGGEERFFTFVNAGAALPAELEARCGAYAPEDAPTAPEALALLRAFIGGARVVTHDVNALLKLYRKAEALNVPFVRECIAADGLAHELCRQGPVLAPGTPADCLWAMGIMPKSEALLDQAEALLELFFACCARMRARGIERLPLHDCMPPAKVKGRRSTCHIILIARNPAGLKHLYKLVSYAHLEHLKGVPQIPRSLLLFYREGLIVGSACEAGEVFRAVLERAPREKLEAIAREYDYLEVQPTGNNEFLVRGDVVRDAEGLRALNRTIVDLGDALGIPVVATGDAHFLDPEDAIFRAIVMSVKEFKDAEQQAPLYFHTTDDMLEEFSYLGAEKAMEIVVENPNRIADSCEKMMPFLSERGTYAPKFPNAGEELKSIAMRRAHEVYGEILPPIVLARLEKELGSIIGNGYASLYLAAERLVKKSNSDGYLVGSRGSVGSSFVATMAGITEVNPLQPHYVCPNCRHSDFEVNLAKYTCGIDMEDARCPQCGAAYQKLGYTIPFEAFLGFKGDKTPDIDLNFSSEYQPVAHKYVEEMFGEGYAFRAGTISGLGDKTVYGYIKKYCETRGEAAFSAAETERLVHGCEGVKRTTGQHPGGIIIVPEGYEIFDFTPIHRPADKTESDIITTHFDFHALDDRLVKLDILGHDDPTAMRLFKEITGVDPQDIPQDDPQTMRIFSSVEPLGTTLEELGCDVGSIGIPEFGTAFVRQMLMDTRPTTMDELVRISGLSHGTDVWLGNAREMVLGGIATLSQVICTREDIMNTLMAMGGEASISFKTMESVRKGRGLTEEMEKNLAALNAPEWFVNSLRKIGYLFPRAHAAAYVMMSFRTAFYKVHYPLAFYAVYFSARADAFDVEAASGGEVSVLKRIQAIKRKGNDAEQKEQDLLTILEVVYEMNRRKIELLPIDLYRSDATRFLIENGALRPPFSAIAGVGAAAAEGIGAAKAGGPFASVEDFRIRTKANSAIVEKLRALGCFKGMPEENQLTLFGMLGS